MIILFSRLCLISQVLTIGCCICIAISIFLEKNAYPRVFHLLIKVLYVVPSVVLFSDHPLWSIFLYAVYIGTCLAKIMIHF